MRYTKMSPAAEKTLARSLDFGVFEQPQRGAEQRIELKRKVALRASWLDQRNRRAQEVRSREIRQYDIALRLHMERYHPEVELSADEFEWEAQHETAHGRKP